MTKLILIFLIILPLSTTADIHFSTDGKVLDPGQYWAILARGEFDDIKQGKKNTADLIHHLKMSASYGFNASRFSLGVIYANGQYNVEQDLPRALAWLELAASGSKDKDMIKYKQQFQQELTTQQVSQAQTIQKEIKAKYGNSAAFKKFKRWVDDETTITGSRIKGSHSGLTVTHDFGNGNQMQTFSLFNRLDELMDLQLEKQNSEVILHEIVPLEDNEQEQDGTN